MKAIRSLLGKSDLFLEIRILVRVAGALES